MSKQTTGVLLPYEKKAIAGDPIPQGLTTPDKVLYIALRGLYFQARSGLITRDQAVAEKRSLLQDYETMKSMDENWKRWVKTVKDTEAARSEYRKNRTIENADKMLLAFDGVK